MKNAKLIYLIFSCLFVLVTTAQQQADSLKVAEVIRQIESFGDDAVKKARFFSELDHQYVERYGKQLYPYIKKEYDDLAINTSLPDALKFEVVFLMRDTYFIFSDYDKTVSLSYEMLDIASKLNDSLLYYYSYIAIADIEAEMENVESSLEFLLLAQKYAVVDKGSLAQTYTDLGRLYYKKEEYELAKENILKGLKLAGEADDSFQLIYGYGELMDYYYAKNKLDSAIVCFHKVDSLVKATHFLESSRGYMNVAIRLAQVYKKQGKYKEAAKYFEMVCDLAKESNDRNNLNYIYEEWANLEALKGNYRKSSELYKQHALLQDSIYDQESIAKINTLKTTFQVERKDAELKASRQKAEYDRIQFWLIFVISIIAILALVILAFYLKSKLKATQLREKLFIEQDKVTKNEVANLEREVHLKNKELADVFLHQFEKATLLTEVLESVDISQNKLKEVLHEHQDQNKDWVNFKSHFDQVHEGFFDKLNALSPDLTPKDIRFCAYIRMNLSSKEIAIMLGISHRTVQGIKGRVRKKIGLEPNDDIVKFLMNL
uniref:tetratricopeptide repeat protein n=3 Tax=Flavobacterium sp. TaxID=239 RepID=UPI00404947E8